MGATEQAAPVPLTADGTTRAAAAPGAAYRPAAIIPLLGERRMTMVK